MGVILGEPIKGHMTRVDRLYARLLCGQFVHSVKNRSIQVFNYLTQVTYCYIVGLGLNCKFIDLLFKHSVIKFIKISSHFGFIVSEIIYNQTDTLTQRLIHQRQF